MRAPVALLLVALAACSHVPTDRDRDHDTDARYDQPDAAAEYYAAKRAGTDNPHARYAAARAQMARMPRYSSNATGDHEIDLWIPLGPGNIGGRTRALIIDDARPEIMYAAGVSGGVWKTHDAGRTWEPIADDLSNLTVNSMAMDPTDHDVLYAGTGEGYFREVVRGTALPLRGNGIFVTRDGGTTWTQLASTTGEDFRWVNDLVISKHDPNRIYAATRTGVWRSTDAGATWKRTLDASNVTGGCLDLLWRGDTPGDYLFASCGTFEQATVYRQKNAEGDSAWERVLSQPNMGRTSLAIAPSNPNIVYALAASNESGNYNQGLLALYRSDASGDSGSWRAQVTNKSSDFFATLILSNAESASEAQCSQTSTRPSFLGMGWYCNTIAVDPLDPERIWAAGVDLFRSDDGGRTWGVASYWWAIPASSAYVHADHHAIVFDPRYDGITNKTMFSANDGGIYRTDDARAEVATGPRSVCDVFRSKVQFVPLNHNYGVTQFYHGAVFPDGRRYIAGAQDNGTVLGDIDLGIDGWSQRYGGDGGYVAIDPVDPKVVYVSYQYARIAKSTDGGGEFHDTSRGLNDDFLFITPYVIDPNDHERLWTGGRSMWRSDDSAGFWRIASDTLPAKVSAIAVAPGNENLVLAGLDNGEIARTTSAAKSTPYDAWPTVRPRAGFVSSLTFDPADANVVYATYAGFGGPHIWKSLDAGLTWSPLDNNLPDLPVHSLAVDPTRRDRLFLGTDLGVFVSTDGGAEWNVENTGFAPVVTEWVTIGQGSRGPAIYAFTHGRGAWRAELVPAGPRRRATR